MGKNTYWSLGRERNKDGKKEKGFFLWRSTQKKEAGEDLSGPRILERIFVSLRLPKISSSF